MNGLAKIEPEEWYQSLVDDCKSIITEAVFTSRWALVEGYHGLGERIVKDSEYKKWEQGKAGRVLTDLSKDTGIHERDLYRAIQFYGKYPELDRVPEGKNITWNKIITKYLPAPKKTESPDLPAGKYRVIYADPPWMYNDKLQITRDGIAESYGPANAHYPQMTMRELCDLPIRDMAEDDAVLFLWVTSPLLEDAFEVVKAWGFEYKTSFVWDKVKHNMGHYNSVRHEFLLVCTRGSCTPDEKKLFDSVQSVERSDKHSEKPKEFREIIETLYTHGKKIELFARTKHEGWKVWGNEV